MKLNAKSKTGKKANEKALNQLKDKGYSVDRFGHAKKEKDGKVYRYKFQATNVRYEVQIIHDATRYSPALKEWMRLKSIPYKNIV